MSRPLAIVLALTILFRIDPTYAQTARLAVPLKLQANQALERNDLATAVSLFDQWLRADPWDSTSWYIVAGIRAGMGDKERALVAWENAVESGWTDSSAAEKDPNLRSIRGEARFQDAFKKIGKHDADFAPKDFVRRTLQMQSRGTYIVMLPADYAKGDRRYPVCVLLHGNGGNETSFGRMADDIGRDDVIYVAPRAPYETQEFASLEFETHPVDYADERGFSAWPPEDFPDTNVLRDDYVNWIFAIVRAVQSEYRTQPKVYVYGHSQGGQFALLSALLHPELVASVFFQAGSIPADSYFTTSNLDAMKAADVKVWIGQGQQDDVVSPARSKMLSDRLKGAGITVTYRSVQGGHAINSAILQLAREWRRTELLSLK